MPPELDTYTDRDIFEIFYRAYVETDPKEKIRKMDERQEAAETEYMKKTLAQRKADYYAMCRNYGFKDDVIEKRWQKYLKTGSTD